MDGQSEPLHRDLAEMGIQLNIVSNNEHVPEIERQIRTLKNVQGRSTAPYHSINDTIPTKNG